MRDFLIFLAFVLILILSIGLSITDTRLKNVERKACRIEQGYDAVIAENEKLVRVTDQTLQIILQGGWDGITSDNGGSTNR